MGHRGFVLDQDIYADGLPMWTQWYTHWGALLRYETPAHRKIPLPLSPKESKHRPENLGLEDMNACFLRTMWPTTYEATTKYVAAYDKDGEVTEPIRMYDIIEDAGKDMDYWEEMHWETTDKICPKCGNPQGLIERTQDYVTTEGLLVGKLIEISDICLVYNDGIYYICFYDDEGSINRIERKPNQEELKLIQKDPTKFEYLKFEYLPQSLRYDCIGCRGSGRFYYNIGTTLWIGTGVEDDMPKVPKWALEYYKLTGDDSNYNWYKQDKRISRHDAIRHSYWGMAWRAQDRQGIDALGPWTFHGVNNEESKDRLIQSVDAIVKSAAHAAPAKKLIKQQHQYHLANLLFNSGMGTYIKEIVGDLNDKEIQTIAPWSVYGVTYEFPIHTINYPRAKEFIRHIRLPENPLPKSFIKMFKEAHQMPELKKYFQ